MVENAEGSTRIVYHKVKERKFLCSHFALYYERQANNALYIFLMINTTVCFITLHKVNTAKYCNNV